jgi:uncharacterized protein involved in tolerance to divalent cations
MFPCGAKTSKKKSQNIENKCLVLKNHNTPWSLSLDLQWIKQSYSKLL